jgi:hypothetical protein
VPSRAAIMADWVPAEDDPPPGPTGSDRDGAYLFFGCRPWRAEYEGQRPGQPPAPTNNSAHDPTTCEVCRAALTDPRITCAGCLSSGQDPHLNAQLVRDVAAAEEKARRLAEQRAAEIGHNYAQRKFKRDRESPPAA